MDETLRYLELRFLAGDWTVYARLVRMRAAYLELPATPSVVLAVSKVRKLRPSLAPLARAFVDLAKRDPLTASVLGLSAILFLGRGLTARDTPRG